MVSSMAKAYWHLNHSKLKFPISQATYYYKLQIEVIANLNLRGFAHIYIHPVKANNWLFAGSSIHFAYQSSIYYISREHG